MQLSQQNYLTKTDLDGSIFLSENSIIMSLWVMVISLGITMTQMDIEMGFSQRIQSHPSLFWQGSFAVDIRQKCQQLVSIS